MLEARRRATEQAASQMRRENSGLIWSIVRRYYGRGVEPDDLYQLGCLGFIKAVKGFDFAFETRFNLCRAEDRRGDPAFSARRRCNQGQPLAA